MANVDLKAALDAVMYRHGPPRLTGLIMVSPEMKAIYTAEKDFYGRDRRRVKREVRKALDRLRPFTGRSHSGIDTATNPWWRNHTVGAN